MREKMEDMERWIERQLESGYDPEQVKESLGESGMDPTLVDQVTENKPGLSLRSLPMRKGAWLSLVICLVFVLYISHGYYRLSGVEVRRSIESPATPLSGPTVELSVRGDFEGVTLVEDIPEELRPVEAREASFEDGRLTWDLEGPAELSYRVSAPRHSGDHSVSGIYTHGLARRDVEGDEELEVRWP